MTRQANANTLRLPVFFCVFVRTTCMLKMTDYIKTVAKGTGERYNEFAMKRKEAIGIEG